jgi:predicted Zn-dependent protease
MARENYAANFVRSPDEQAMATYVERVGTQLAARAHRKLPYKFHYIPGGFDNAFALPGGHIYIGGGLIASMDSEDQLAAVLGHELAHADRRHCAERVQIEARMRKLNLGVIGSLAQIPIQVFQAGYSKTQELEADKVGTELAVRAGYSPFGALRLFEKFDAMNREEPSRPRPRSPQQEVLRLTIGTLSGYFRSHPPAGERMVQLRRMISSNHWESRTQEKPLEIRSN